MCGRFVLKGIDDCGIAEKAIRKLLDLNETKTEGEAYPSDIVPVLSNSKNREICLFSMKWGYTAMGKCVFNAKSETAMEKNMFRDGMLNRRCIIPSKNYYEWGETNKIKYAISPSGENSTFLAGIYRFEGNTPVFTVLTKDASASISLIHKRMPVIFSKEQALKWLDLNENPMEIIENNLTDMVYFEAE